MAKKKRGRKTNKRKNLKFIYILIMIVVVVFTCYYFKDEIMDAISQIIIQVVMIVQQMIFHQAKKEKQLQH